MNHTAELNLEAMGETTTSQPLPNNSEVLASRLLSIYLLILARDSLGGKGIPPPVFFEGDINKCRVQIKFFLRKLYRIRSSEIKTCEIWQHFY